MAYGWIKYNGYSYICKILEYSMNSRKCVINLGGYEFYDVPFNELQPIYNSKLPWE